MQILKTADAARDWVFASRASGKTVGLVPTMGALHDGHLSLVRQSREHCDLTVATIFVNPTQFAPTEDLDKYPRTLDEDCEKLSAEGADAVFIPSVDDMYPDGFSTYVDPPSVASTLEGECRPGHFRGVTTIVLKLFQALPTTHAFFGRKDYQQFKVIEAMTKDLQVGIEIHAGETVREPDGLAMSSRNRYLSDSERLTALSLNAALSKAAELFLNGERRRSTIEGKMSDILKGSSKVSGVDHIDYAVVVDANDLTPHDHLSDHSVALIAAYVGDTRLIDNRELSAGSAS